jgi:hypothetical protein
MMEMQFDVGLLRADSYAGYLLDPLPSSRDSVVESVIRGASQHGQLEQLAAHLDSETATTLAVFGERMASLAVRQKSASTLRVGILAIRLAASADEHREAVLVLPLLWNSAILLGLDPASEFNDAVGWRGATTLLGDFASRPAADRALGSMGYVEVDEPTGLMYRRTW